MVSAHVVRFSNSLWIYFKWQLSTGLCWVLLDSRKGRWQSGKKIYQKSLESSHSLWWSVANTIA